MCGKLFEFASHRTPIHAEHRPGPGRKPKKLVLQQQQQQQQHQLQMQQMQQRVIYPGLTVQAAHAPRLPGPAAAAADHGAALTLSTRTTASMTDIYGNVLFNFAISLPDYRPQQARLFEQ